MVKSRRESPVPESEMAMLLIVIRSQHWSTPIYFSAAIQKQSWDALSETLQR